MLSFNAWVRPDAAAAGENTAEAHRTDEPDDFKAKLERLTKNVLKLPKVPAVCDRCQVVSRYGVGYLGSFEEWCEDERGANEANTVAKQHQEGQQRVAMVEDRADAK